METEDKVGDQRSLLWMDKKGKRNDHVFLSILKWEGQTHFCGLYAYPAGELHHRGESIVFAAIRNEVYGSVETILEIIGSRELIWNVISIQEVRLEGSRHSLTRFIFCS